MSIFRIKTIWKSRDLGATPEKVKVSQEASWSCLKQRCLKFWMKALNHEKLLSEKSSEAFSKPRCCTFSPGSGGGTPPVSTWQAERAGGAGGFWGSGSLGFGVSVS